MKNQFLKTIAFLAVVLSIFIISCGKDNTDPEEEVPVVDLVKTTATADHNIKSGGVYKAVLVGSTGSLKIVLQQNVKAIYIVFDGVTKTLTTTDLTNWSSGQAISNATFTSGDWKAVFSVNADGSEPVVAVTIPGHTIRASTVKETTASLTTAFEGRFTVNGQSSTFNFVVKGTDTLMGTILTTDLKTVVLGGKVSNNQISATANSGTGIIVATGTINGNNASGTFTETGTGGNNYHINGTWATTKSF